MYQSSNKILALVGNFSPFLYDVADALCASDLHFEQLKVEEIFVAAVRDVTHEYFFEEILHAQNLLQKKFLHYLDLLYEIQKRPEKEARAFYAAFYPKVQAMNKIILYKFYERLYQAALGIQKKGLNCVFVHNYFYTPYPKRPEVFLDFFRLFGEDFKTLDVYTTLQLSLELLESTNQNFISFVTAQPNAYEAYRALQNAKCDREALQNFHDPLLLLSLFPKMYAFSDMPRKDALEAIHGVTLRELYRRALPQTKKMFGFLVHESYPSFYPKIERLNSVKNSDFFLKNEKMTYISKGRRIQSDYTLIFTTQLSQPDTSALLPEKFLRNLESWICRDRYIPYHEAYTEEPPAVAPQALQFFSVSSSQLSQIKPNELSNVYDEDGVERFFNRLFEGFCLPYGKSFSLVTSGGFWIHYHLNIRRDETVELQCSIKTGQPLNKCAEHLILLNSLYIHLLKLLNRHFFITCTPLKKRFLSSPPSVFKSQGAER
jgi:hypothetical protein